MLWLGHEPGRDSRFHRSQAIFALSDQIRIMPSSVDDAATVFKQLWKDRLPTVCATSLRRPCFGAPRYAGYPRMKRLVARSPEDTGAGRATMARSRTIYSAADLPFQRLAWFGTVGWQSKMRPVLT